jgi:hypothetical protein
MLKQFIIIIAIVTFSIEGHCQSLNDDLIRLAKIYRNFHFSNDPPKDVVEQLNIISSAELRISKEFIGELIKKNNKITTRQYLTKPDSLTLKHIFTIRSINWNLFEADPKDNYKLIDSLNRFPASNYEKLACYYGLIFVSVGNKNAQSKMSTENFTLDDYGLKDDTEKGIFFLKSMETFGSMIWGYMNIVKPPNFEKALTLIKEFPQYNGQPYYQFQDLNFQDFNLTTDKRKPKESFKKFYINKYLNTLLYHSMCLGQKKKMKKEQEDLMLGSIMRNESYYKFSDNPETFRKIFKKIKDD